MGAAASFKDSEDNLVGIVPDVTTEGDALLSTDADDLAEHDLASSVLG